MEAGGKGNNAAGGCKRQFLGMVFDCCGAYGRLYPNRDRSAFVGRCPRCMRAVSVGISEEGSDARFLRG